MLKLFGSLCILAASSGMAYVCMAGLRREIHMTERLQDLLITMEGELSYSRSPLPELLAELSRHMQPPYQELLWCAGKMMEDSSVADIPSLWKDACGRYAPQLALPEEAYGVLLRTGEAFAYASLESSLRLLRLGQKKLAVLLEKKYAQFADRKKLYCCLCYMAGLFTIIILL